MKMPPPQPLSASAPSPVRRHLLAAGVAGGLGLGLAAQPVRAQDRPIVEGTDFRLIQPPQAPETPGRIEVVEFFWLACPHCFALEPLVKDWQRRQSADVLFRKVHVPFNEVRHQQLYYTLVTLGKVDELLDKAFNTIHVDRNMLNTVDKINQWAVANGVDKTAFTAAWESFSVQTAMRKATAMAAAYKVDSVPMLAVNGRYMTAPSMAGSNGAALATVDALVNRERKGR